MMPLLGRMYADFVGVGRRRTSDRESMGSSSSMSSSSLVDVVVGK